jgi:cyclopropane-fatty-acyl-phospholipid synthase
VSSTDSMGAQALEPASTWREVAAEARAYLEGLANPESFVRELLEKAGIEVGGAARHDIAVHDRRFYARVARDGALGLGESYVDGWWDSPAVDEMITRLHLARLPAAIRKNWKYLASVLKARLLNLQSRARAYRVGEHHYDVGNDLYRAMLDRRMVYTCAYWNGARDLDAAQEAKLELVCRKLGLRVGMRVLELGCGWGSFAKYAAERHGVEVTGFSVSKEQVALGRELCAGLPVELRLDDYRNARGRYDRVVSIGLMEHVGYKNYRAYMEVVDRCLAPGGVSLVHTIGSATSQASTDEWTQKYTFPNGQLPSIAQLSRAMEGLFTFEDLHTFGPHYDPTLMAWYRNFTAAWPALKAKYGERFGRIWSYYLLMSAAGFRARYMHLFQILFSRGDTPSPNCTVR